MALLSTWELLIVYLRDFFGVSSAQEIPVSYLNKEHLQCKAKARHCQQTPCVLFLSLCSFRSFSRKQRPYIEQVCVRGGFCPCFTEGNAELPELCPLQPVGLLLPEGFTKPSPPAHPLPCRAPSNLQCKSKQTSSNFWRLWYPLPWLLLGLCIFRFRGCDVFYKSLP